MRLLNTALAVAVCLVAAAGCGSEDPPATPAACLEGSGAFVEALAAAPAAVELDGTPLSDCLPEEQPAGAIATVGEGMLGAAQELNEQARKQPLGDVPVQLGYLVGAVESRASETGGIHEDLAINVEAAATLVPGDEVLPGGFQQRYEEGLSAGRDSG